jgi:hypothetical protein
MERYTPHYLTKMKLEFEKKKTKEMKKTLTGQGLKFEIPLNCTTWHIQPLDGGLPK